MIQGFSKLTVDEKIDALTREYSLSSSFKEVLNTHQHAHLQDVYNQFSENTISNFYLPYGIAPGFVINGNTYAVPMVIEESSVVAAASKAAKFWAQHGGFKARIIATTKIGQLFFTSDWKYEQLLQMIDEISDHLKKSVSDLTHKMNLRGGGITAFELESLSPDIEDTYCLKVSFETVDSMGANFINSCLEQMGEALNGFLSLKDKSNSCEIIMAILSNYTPDCLVKCSVSCAIDDLKAYSGKFNAQDFVSRFKRAIDIANHSTARAVTHNKGIMNGVDAVVLATGNDFRAIEAGIHAYASRNGKYSSLSAIELNKNTFTYSITIPLAIGTVGGLTNLHPMVKQSMNLLGKPNAKELMQIIAASGLANNFSAVAALVTSGIQKGHMKMHLSNILSTLEATNDEKIKAIDYFKNHTVSHSAVESFLKNIRITH